MKTLKKLIMYMVRWQLSTPILAIFTGGMTYAAMVNASKANLIGALIFFPIDKYIFKEKKHEK